MRPLAMREEKRRRALVSHVALRIRSEQQAGRAWPQRWLSTIQLGSEAVAGSNRLRLMGGGWVASPTYPSTAAGVGTRDYLIAHTS